MMKIIVNEQELELDEHCSLSDALIKAGFNRDKSGFAIAINCEFIPRSLYDSTLLKPNDVIEVLTAMQGG